MKRRLTYLFVTLTSLMFSSQTMAQQEELQQLILNLQKLNQLREVLNQLKKGYEVLTQGYNTIKNLSEGNFNLHQEFLDKQLQISPAVKGYIHIADIISLQVQIVARSKEALKARQQSQLFSADELYYMAAVYADVIDRSRKNLEELLLVVTANHLRMDEEQRIKAIDRIYESMKEKISYIAFFNKKGSVLADQRKKKTEENSRLRDMYK